MSFLDSSNESRSIMRLEAILLNRTYFTKGFEFATVLLIYIVSIFGNGLFCIALVKQSRWRNTTEFYIFSLLSTSLLMMVLCGTPSVMTSLTSRWILGNIICIGQAFLTEILAISTVHHLAIIAINRYVKVCRSQFYKKLFSPNRTLLSLVFLWFLSLGSVLLRVFFVTVKPSFHPGTMFCASQPLSKTVGPGLATVAILIHIAYPVLAVIYCYFKVFRAMRTHVQSVQSLSETVKQKATEIKVSKVLFLTVLAFCFCWSPVFVIRTLQVFVKDDFPRYA